MKLKRIIKEGQEVAWILDNLAKARKNIETLYFKYLGVPAKRGKNWKGPSLYGFAFEY